MHTQDWLFYADFPERPAPAALIRFAEERGLSGNLCRLYWTDQLMRSENPYSLACERCGLPTGSIAALADHDFERLQALFHTETDEIFALLQDYRASAENLSVPAENAALYALCDELAAAPTAGAFQRALSRWYGAHGVGIYSQARAFRLDGHGGLLPIHGLERITFDQLVGYAQQKAALRANVEAFLHGIPANDMLLYGDAGTGKSTSVKALLSAYGDQGLRIVEISKPQFPLLGDLITRLGERPYRFLIFMDDLSFEENEIGYKHLKAVIEGGIAPRPDNVLLCATSNRRHIVREIWRDRSDMEYNEDVHRSDTMEEKLSLAGRFGCQINYSTPDRALYHAIVRELAAQSGIRMDEAALLRQADAWEIRHGGVSGRAARQYIHHLLGLQGLDERKD